MTFASLSYQLQNVKTNGYTKTEICDAILKSISPELPLRAYLESKIKTRFEFKLGNILREHFRESNSLKLFTEISNNPVDLDFDRENILCWLNFGIDAA